MGLGSLLTNIFDRFRGNSDMPEAARGFNFRSFDDNVSSLLASHNILNVRNVGGTFRMTPELAQSFRGMRFDQDFDVATVVLSDKGNEAAAYMIGLRHDGQYAIRSLQNIARPNDLDRYIDRIQARINAHGYRETFRHSAILMRNERSSGFYPERYVDRPSALEPLGRSTTPSPI